MNKRLEELKTNDYKLIGICNKKTDNEIVLDSNSNQEYYKELIESHKETINHNGISKCYICNHKIKDIYFLNCDKDIKVIGGSGCLNKFGNIKVNCKCCLEEFNITIKDFELNIMKDKKIDNFDYVCNKCGVDYKDIKYNDYEKLDKNYYNEWVFREIDNLDKKDYSWCNNCNYIYKSNNIDCGLCKYCMDKLTGNYDNNICKKYKYDYSNKNRNKRLIVNNNYFGKCYCKNCCFKDTNLNKLLELNNDIRMKIRNKEIYIVSNTYDNLMINNVKKYYWEILGLIKSNDYNELDRELDSIYNRVMIDSIDNVNDWNKNR